VLDGLKRKVRDAFIRRELRKVERKHMGKIKAALAWVNEVPGRKRTIAAVAGALSVLLRGLDYSCVADGVDAANAWIQTLTPAMDLATVAFGLIGIVDARRKGNL
jgi:hypothetical protein